MTIAELIKELKSYPDTTEVVIGDDPNQLDNFTVENRGQFVVLVSQPFPE